MRAHANFTEYTPFALILTGLLEVAGTSPIWLWIGAFLYLVARVLHAFGMDRTEPNWLRGGGAMLTWLVLLALAGAALVVAYGAETARPTPAPISANV